MIHKARHKKASGGAEIKTLVDLTPESLVMLREGRNVTEADAAGMATGCVG